MVRAFFAVPLPGEVVPPLQLLQEELGRIGAPVRWVRPDGFHVTVKFLGETPEDRVDGIASRVAGAPSLAKGPVRLRLVGVEGLGPQRRPRTIVGGVEEAGRLAALAGEVDRLVAEEGFAREDRAFRAHVTLGRVKAPKGLDGLLAAMERMRGAEVGRCEAAELVMFSSELRPDGAHYEVLRRFSL